MIYKFKSKAAGDVIMLGPNGDETIIRANTRCRRLTSPPTEPS